MNWNIENKSLVHHFTRGLGNRIFPATPVSHQQFQTYMRDFRDAAESYFQTYVTVETTVSRGVPRYSTWGSSDTVASDGAHNQSIEMMSTWSLADITPELWEQAGYVESVLRAPEAEHQKYSVGRATFLGLAPQSAGFRFDPLHHDFAKVHDFCEGLKAQQLGAFPSTSLGEGRVDNAYVRVGKGVDPF
ncbi:MAG: hypothetical protein AB7E85_06155 [Pseudobdellovibrionaceae bacterium]